MAACCAGGTWDSVCTQDRTERAVSGSLRQQLAKLSKIIVVKDYLGRRAVVPLPLLVFDVRSWVPAGMPLRLLIQWSQISISSGLARPLVALLYQSQSLFEH